MRKILCICLLIIAVGCARKRFTVERDDFVGLEGKRSYSITVPSLSTIDLSVKDPELFETQVVSSLEHEFTQRQFALVPALKADLIVEFRASESDPIYFSPPPGATPPASHVDDGMGETVILKPGSLVVLIYDGEGGPLIWYGYAEGALLTFDSTEERQQDLGFLVWQIMEGLPPTVAANSPPHSRPILGPL